MSNAKRRDNKGRVLQMGESQQDDGRYVYRYMTPFGQRKAVYSWRLTASDPNPAGKRKEKSLREKIKDIEKRLRLETFCEGSIELEGSDGGYVPISGEAGHREPKKDPLTIIIYKINERFGTQFTEMDKVLVQMENDYAKQEKWQSYAKNNDRLTFMLLFEKDFPTMAAERYEQNDEFFRRLFGDPDMMKQVMDTVGAVLYERLKKQFIYDPKSGVIDEATPETYVEDTYVKFD